MSDSPGVEAFRMVKDFFDGDSKKAMTWMRERNPLLGGVSPRDMVANGRSDKLLKWVKSALGENEPPEKSH